MVLNLNITLVSCLRLQFAVAHPDRQESKNLSAAIQAHGRQPSGERNSCSLGSVQLMPSFPELRHPADGGSLLHNADRSRAWQITA